VLHETPGGLARSNHGGSEGRARSRTPPGEPYGKRHDGHERCAYRCQYGTVATNLTADIEHRVPAPIELEDQPIQLVAQEGDLSTEPTNRLI
jgi:hypothetical protein